MSPAHISPFSGTWYPEEATELDALLNHKYECSSARTGQATTPGLGFVVPHAGPAYSGTVAAAVYRTLQEQQAERVVLLAFPHHGRLRGIATPEVDAIETPFGRQAIDRSFSREFRVVPEARLCDHSCEMQIPFFQKSLPHAILTPLYVGSLDLEERRRAAGVLARAWSPGTVFLASSDFTHYGREFGHLPFADEGDIAGNLRELDFEYIDAAGSCDSQQFLAALARHDGNVCGAQPIALLLEVMRLLEGGNVYPTTLDYQTSGEITGDWRHCVSYAALGFHAASAFRVSDLDAGVLLDSAAATLRGLVENGHRHAVPARGGSPNLAAKRAAFVSLHRGEELLGCIGNLAGRAPLSHEIAALALSAALDDPRFGPATFSRGPFDLEISILTPFRRIRHLTDFEVGRHGALLLLEQRSGLLLPQVAEGLDWTAEDFIRAVERKAHLWKGAWRDPRARLFVFEAQILSRRNAVA